MNAQLHPGTAIPFRAEHTAEGSQIVGALLTAIALLALATLSLLYARRKGWLKRWLPAAGSGSAPRGASEVRLCSRRLSRQSTFHLVEVDGKRFAVVESSANVSLQLLDDRDGEDGDAR